MTVDGQASATGSTAFAYQAVATVPIPVASPLGLLMIGLAIALAGLVAMQGRL